MVNVGPPDRWDYPQKSERARPVEIGATVQAVETTVHFLHVPFSVSKESASKMKRGVLEMLNFAEIRVPVRNITTSDFEPSLIDLI